MELIDKEQAYKELSEYYQHNEFIQHLCLSEALDRVPVVDAIPVERIKNIADMLRNFLEFGNEEIRTASYYGVQMLDSLIETWQEEQEEHNA